MPNNPLLTRETIAILTAPGTREDALEAAANLLAIASGLSAENVLESLVAREALGGTALGHGVALPHGRVDGARESRAAFLRLQHPVQFGEEPVDLVYALLVPSADARRHLGHLAALARVLSEPGIREALRKAQDVDALWTTITRHGLDHPVEDDAR